MFVLAVVVVLELQEEVEMVVVQVSQEKMDMVSMVEEVVSEWQMQPYQRQDSLLAEMQQHQAPLQPLEEDYRLAQLEILISVLDLQRVLTLAHLSLGMLLEILLLELQIS